jgi:hypothetical protein
MKKYVSRALWCALLAGGLTVLGATAANAAESGGEDGLVSGNQVLSSITAPVAVEGNAISLLGDSSSSGTSTGPAAVTGNDDEGFLGFGNDDERVLRLGFASEVGAVVDGNIADERVDDNAKEGRTNAAVIQGTSAGSADGELETLALNEPVAAEGDLSTQALAATGADAGNGATAAALMLGAGLTLTTVARRKSLRL